MPDLGSRGFPIPVFYTGCQNTRTSHVYKNMTKQIQVSPFARGRHLPETAFSHFEGSWEELEQLTEASFDKRVPGYRDGVVLVPVPPEGFKAGTMKLEVGTPLAATFEARREGEEASITVVATNCPKTDARRVDIVLYRHDVLEEDKEASCDSEWEIVSVNARVTKEDEPMDPMTMARNFLHMEGGTKATFTAEEFAKSIVFWSQHCRRG